MAAAGAASGRRPASKVSRPEHLHDEYIVSFKYPQAGRELDHKLCLAVDVGERLVRARHKNHPHQPGWISVHVFGDSTRHGFVPSEYVQSTMAACDPNVKCFIDHGEGPPSSAPAWSLEEMIAQSTKGPGKICRIVDEACTSLEKNNGMWTRQLFRIPGGAQRIEMMQRMYAEGRGFAAIETVKPKPMDWATLLARWLRTLNPKLIHWDADGPEIEELLQISDGEHEIQDLRVDKVLMTLQDGHRQTAVRLIEFLRMVSPSAISPRDLSKVLAPDLFEWGGDRSKLPRFAVAARVLLQANRPVVEPQEKPQHGQQVPEKKEVPPQPGGCGSDKCTIL